MSRKLVPGLVQQGLEQILRTNPNTSFTVTELAKTIYAVEKPAKKHRVVVLRALKAIGKRMPIWQQRKPTGPGLPGGLNVAHIAIRPFSSGQVAA